MIIDKTAISRLGMLVACLVAVGHSPGVAQSKETFVRKYRTIAAFVVRPGIVMTTDFGEDGQICKAVVFKAPTELDGPTTFTDRMADELLDELVPVSRRGKVQSGNLNPDSFIGGGVFFLKKDYSLVSIEKSGHINGPIDSLRIFWKRKTCKAHRP